MDFAELAAQLKLRPFKTRSRSELFPRLSGNHYGNFVAVSAFVAAVHRGSDVIERLAMSYLCIVISCTNDPGSHFCIGATVRSPAVEVITRRVLAGGPG